MTDFFIRYGGDVYHCRWNSWVKCTNLTSPDKQPKSPLIEKGQLVFYPEYGKQFSIARKSSNDPQFINIDEDAPAQENFDLQNVVMEDPDDDNGSQFVEHVSRDRFKALLQSKQVKIGNDVLLKKIDAASKPEIITKLFEDKPGAITIFHARGIEWRDPNDGFKLHKAHTISTSPKNLKDALLKLKKTLPDPSSYDLVIFNITDKDWKKLAALEAKAPQTFNHFTDRTFRSETGWCSYPPFLPVAKNKRNTNAAERSITLIAIEKDKYDIKYIDGLFRAIMKSGGLQPASNDKLSKPFSSK